MTEEGKLAAAILRGDVAAAQAQLDYMRMASNRWALACQEGRRLAFPPAALPRLSEPFVLPVPGHVQGSTIGDPRLAA